jgi:hypothetical protein
MKTSKVKIDYSIFKIVANGALSDSERGEGRLYPVLIIDVGDNIEVKELFKLHKESPPGDTNLTWGRPPTTFFKPKIVVLIFNFIKPIKISFGVEFDIKTQFSLADGVIQQRGVILASGKSGNKVAELISDSIIVEVPNVDFDQVWNKILIDTLNDKYKKMGSSRKEANNYTKKHINSMRELWNKRRASD